ncbi:MAG: hypothetical protein ACPG5T_06390, partial [Endozoicomonas sp.]
VDRTHQYLCPLGIYALWVRHSFTKSHRTTRFCAKFRAVYEISGLKNQGGELEHNYGHGKDLSRNNFPLST